MEFVSDATHGRAGSINCSSTGANREGSRFDEWLFELESATPIEPAVAGESQRAGYATFNRPRRRYRHGSERIPDGMKGKLAWSGAEGWYLAFLYCTFSGLPANHDPQAVVGTRIGNPTNICLRCQQSTYQRRRFADASQVSDRTVQVIVFALAVSQMPDWR
ncbi:protein of unknown function [Methylocaldum szegediense]|uniref:Uncharacterized protein n=1 Tax=Methylocaldum szegediense TaxID=73780 RepID=A0ABM9I033_9GAMM|nr:protein of unknown function [Methylocaldum szegediense]